MVRELVALPEGLDLERQTVRHGDGDLRECGRDRVLEDVDLHLAGPVRRNCDLAYGPEELHVVRVFPDGVDERERREDRAGRAVARDLHAPDEARNAIVDRPLRKLPPNLVMTLPPFRARALHEVREAGSGSDRSRRRVIGLRRPLVSIPVLFAWTTDWFLRDER